MSITFVVTSNRIFGLSILTAGRGREEGPDSLLRGVTATAAVSRGR
jgi:hypothetical protein